MGKKDKKGGDDAPSTAPKEVKKVSTGHALLTYEVV
jgi:hypothetical protein